MSSKIQDVLGLLRGLQIVANASVKYNEACLKHFWSHSSIKDAVDVTVSSATDLAKKATSDPVKEITKVQGLIKESLERQFVVIEGVRQFVTTRTATQPKTVGSADFDATGEDKPRASKTEKTDEKSASSGKDIDEINRRISSLTLKELELILAKRNKERLNLQKTIPPLKKMDPIPKPAEPQSPTRREQKDDEKYVENVLKVITGQSDSNQQQSNDDSTTIKLPELSAIAKQRKVPATRIGRMASFGNLFAGLGVGTINELAKGAIGLGEAKTVKDAFLSPANAERIVDTLCKVRGAALKLGQILSIQDSTFVSPQLVKAFERVRQAADYMPDSQVEKVMSSELGSDWRNQLLSFDEKPFAAASIGQVHRGVLKNGMEVAIKVQYPGVARSIESDIDNLVGMLKLWDVFPKGFFIDNVVKVAKRELRWEVDYTREAEYTSVFGEMISPYKEYYVPKVIKELTTRSVLTTELVPGLPLDKCFQLSYEHRKIIAESVLKLCLRELFVFQCMQTDPNWSNFLYDQTTKKLMLIDFGSTRFYSKDFIRNYREVIIAAVENDRAKVLDVSKKMKFLTGYESKQMEEAHTDAVMILGDIFRYKGEFDFGKQDTTKKIAQLVPTMVAHRLCPPPEEIYSIHRKLSGVFLLCSRLDVKLNGRECYEQIVLKDATVK